MQKYAVVSRSSKHIYIRTISCTIVIYNVFKYQTIFSIYLACQIRTLDLPIVSYHGLYVKKSSIIEVSISKYDLVASVTYTVKLGYNELGYNEHSVITNKYLSPKWSIYYTN